MSYKSDTLCQSLNRANAPVVVDVRSKSEYRQGHIPGALHLSFWMMPFRYKSLVGFREKPIVIYCEHGPRAALAMNVLLSKGFCDVDCLEGHMSEWRNAGHPIDHS